MNDIINLWTLILESNTFNFIVLVVTFLVKTVVPDPRINVTLFVGRKIIVAVSDIGKHGKSDLLLIVDTCRLPCG